MSVSDETGQVKWISVHVLKVPSKFSNKMFILIVGSFGLLSQAILGYLLLAVLPILLLAILALWHCEFRELLTRTRLNKVRLLQPFAH